MVTFPKPLEIPLSSQWQSYPAVGLTASLGRAGKISLLVSGLWMTPWDLTTYPPFPSYQPVHTWVYDHAISKVKHFAGFDSTLFLFAVATSFSIILPSATKNMGKPSFSTGRTGRGIFGCKTGIMKDPLMVLSKTKPFGQCTVQIRSPALVVWISYSAGALGQRLHT